jgi:DNA end-binding protein Ku
MASSRSFWKGHLRLSLVTCPVTMVPATSTRRMLRFHTINRATGNRLESRYIDEQTGKPVPDTSQRRAYPLSPDDLVILEDKELDAVALESTRVIDIDQFVARDDIPWIWLDKPYYLLPDAKVAEDAYLVIRDAMAATGTVGIARLVLHRRERAVMLAPRDNGIMVWALRYGDEVREAEDYFADIDPTKPAPKARKLFNELVRERMTEWSSDMVQDPVQKRLKAMIAARKRKTRASPAKTGPAAKAGQEKADNVVSITEALRKSLEAERTGRR